LPFRCGGRRAETCDDIGGFAKVFCDRDRRKWGNGDLTREPTTPRFRLVRQATPPRTMDIEPVDRARWTELAHGFADHNYRQCWDFGIQAASRVDAKSEHLAVRQAGEVVAI